MDIYRKEEEAQKKINILSEEIAHLKKKTQDQRKQHDIQERSMIFQSRKMKEL
jgi:ABC-type enterochelin transport system substrate-binding protein